MDLDQLIFVDKDASEGKIEMAHSHAHSSPRVAIQASTRIAKDMATVKAIRIAKRQGHGNRTWPTVKGNIDRIRDVFCSQSALLRAVGLNEKGQ